jgi:hypothetical protein
MISVVIPHLNQPEALEAGLSIDAQSLARCFFEIIGGVFALAAITESFRSRYGLACDKTDQR